MINIYFENNTPCIYRIEDWEILRRQYRIIGELLGHNFRIPSLPLKLLPEEALLLINRGICKLVSHPKLQIPPTPTDKEKYDELQRSLLQEQRTLYKDIRKRQIESVMDQIVAGKKRKGDQRSYDEIFDDELNKSCHVSDDTMLWPTLLQHMDCVNGELLDVDKGELLKLTTHAKITVFADLWEKGYYITAGNKFGGDFLVYLGDPIIYHAVNIVRCVDYEKSFHTSEIVAYGRLGTSVKKSALLATVIDEKTIKYITLNWIGT